MDAPSTGSPQMESSTSLAQSSIRRGGTRQMTASLFLIPGLCCQCGEDNRGI